MSRRDDGGLNAALFDALDLIGGHGGPLGQFGNAETWARRWSQAALPRARAWRVIRRIFGLLRRADPAPAFIVSGNPGGCHRYRS